MTKKEAPMVLQFETDDFYQFALDLVLYNMGLKPAEKIGKKVDVKKAIQDIESKKMQPDVVVVDSYMGISNEDGSKIAEKIRDISPSTKIIGYSIMDTDWADFSIIKSQRDTDRTVVKVLEEALGRKFDSSDLVDPEYSHD